MNIDFDAISAVVDRLAPEMFDFIAALVKSPSLPGQEAEVQGMVSRKLESLGLTVETVPCDLDEVKRHPAFCDDGVPLESRFNVVGRWLPPEGPRGRDGLILNGHVDVVSPGDETLWHDSPWSGVIRDGKLYGRGSCDMKAGLSAGIFALQTLRTLGFRPAKGVTLQSVVGEESGGIGALATIVKGYRAEGVVIMEPTDLDICPVQSGALTFRLKISGKGAHGCIKQFGVSAIEKFVPIMQALQDFERRRHEAFHHPLFPDPTAVAPLSIGTVRSGDWPSSVPDELTAEGRFGIFPGESLSHARVLFTDAVMAAAGADDWLKDHPPAVEWFEGQFESGETAMDAPVVRGVQSAHRRVFGGDPAVRGVTYGSDLRLFTNHADTPAVLYGPGSILDAHAADEKVDLDQVAQCAKVLALTIIECCGATR